KLSIFPRRGFRVFSLHSLRIGPVHPLQMPFVVAKPERHVECVHQTQNAVLISTQLLMFELETGVFRLRCRKRGETDYGVKRGSTTLDFEKNPLLGFYRQLEASAIFAKGGGCLVE